jgi:hypothetical protein
VPVAAHGTDHGRGLRMEGGGAETAEKSEKANSAA